LFAAAVAAVLWLNRHQAPPASPAPDAPLLQAFTEDNVRRIAVACGAHAVTLERDGPRSWRIVEPVAAEADPRRARDVVSALQDAKVKKVIAEAGADPAAFGLAPAACTVRIELQKAAPALTLRLGRGSPVGSERYAATADGRVVLTDGTLFGVLARDPDAFREKRLFPVESGDITHITVERPEGRVALALQDGGCRLEAPVSDLAATAACASLARALSSAEVEGPPVAQLPRDVRPDRRVRIEVAARTVPSPMVAIVAAKGVEGKRLAFRDGGAVSGLVEERAAGELERPAESFRDTRILSFSSPDVFGLTIEREGRTLKVTRKDEASPWTGTADSNPIPLDGSRVLGVLDALRNLSAAGFETEAPRTPAAATIAVSGAAGELARVTFGPLPKVAGDRDASVWLTTPVRPGVVFRTGASALKAIPVTDADLLPQAKP
jgi:hypothetical protein